MNIKKQTSVFIVVILAFLLSIILCTSQSVEEIAITVQQVDAHIKLLSSDSLKGRGSFSKDIRMTEDYIAQQFKEAGLKVFEQFPNYRHEFTHIHRDRYNPDASAKQYRLANIVGYVEGDSELREEFIVFGAHHDHVGIFGDTEDNIYNGAEDNASGTTAVITLAQYYANNRGNRRSIMFITFAAEEVGMIGSRRFVRDLPVDKEQIKAVINFEMIGKPSDEGRAVCYLTGWDRSDMPKIMKKSLGNDPLSLIEGPEITDRLFFASDNIPFARAGMVAHTLAGIQSTADSLAHHPDDEYETLNIETMTDIIRGTIRASRTLISGEKTPKVLKPVKKETR